MGKLGERKKDLNSLKHKFDEKITVIREKNELRDIVEKLKDELRESDTAYGISTDFSERN